MKRQIATALLALGLSAAPAMAMAPQTARRSCAKLADLSYDISIDRDRGTAQLDEIGSGVDVGLTPDQQFYFKWLINYVFVDHANEPPSQVERSFYRDCMDANSNE